MVYRTLQHLCPIPHDCQISKEKHKIRLIKSPSIRQPGPRWSHFMTFAGLISRWITLIHRQGTVESNDKDRSTEWTLWQRVIDCSCANHLFSRLDDFFKTLWFASKVDMQVAHNQWVCLQTKFLYNSYWLRGPLVGIIACSRNAARTPESQVNGLTKGLSFQFPVIGCVASRIDARIVECIIYTCKYM